MKKILLLLFLMIGIDAMAQTVGYSRRVLAADDTNAKYSVVKRDTAYYIIATISSARTKFLQESTMLIKNFDGEVIKLKGSLISNDTKSAGRIAGDMIQPVTYVYSTAQFRITPEQFELIKNGIAKVRLSTIPIEHERTFRKDKIGRKLYQFYLKVDDF